MYAESCCINVYDTYHKPLCRSSCIFKNPKVELALDSNVLYTISDKPTLTGEELWVDDPSRLPRQTHQYLHFKVSVHNELEKLVPVWFSIGFPAMKVLVVTDGVSVWKTGDDSPYSTRPVNAPNYHFPPFYRHQVKPNSAGICGKYCGIPLR